MHRKHVLSKRNNCEIKAVKYGGNLDFCPQAKKLKQLSEIDMCAKNVASLMVTGLKRTDPGLLIGVDIFHLKAFVVAAIWKESGKGNDGSIAVEVLCGKGDLG